MQIIFEGIAEALAAIEEMVLRQHAATRAATAKALHLVERETKSELSKNSHRRGTPSPAGPGEPPALVTGNLRRSISVTGPDPKGVGTWEGRVGPTAVYGRIQELGGRTGRSHAVNLPPRPYLQPTIERLHDDIARIFYEAWAAAAEI